MRAEQLMPFDHDDDTPTAPSAPGLNGSGVSPTYRELWEQAVERTDELQRKTKSLELELNRTRRDPSAFVLGALVGMLLGTVVAFLLCW
jgi:hypothetical protein